MSIRKPILFSIFQTQNRSNGGVNSLTQILEQDSSISPIIVTNTKGPFNERWASKNWRIIQTNIKWGNASSGKQGSFGKISDLVKSNLTVLKTLRSEKINILYCNDVQAFWCAYFGGAMAGARIVFNLRDTKSEKELESLGKWRFIAQKSDVIIVLSEEMKTFVLTYLLDNKQQQKVVVSYSIVNHEKFHPVDISTKQALRNKLGINNEKFVISYVAAFNGKKAQLPFIENVVSRFRNNADILFAFIGDFDTANNPYAMQCLETVRSLGIEDIVHFEGHASNIDEWYKASDLVALASTKEGLARCMIESISCGTPFLSFDVCSAREILEGPEKCGTVVKMGDYDGMYNSIVDYTNKSGTSANCGDSGYQLSRKLFNKESVLARYAKIYERLF